MNRDQTNPRPLEEYLTLEYILLGDLRDLLEEPPNEQTRHWLIAVLEALLQTLPREFSLKEKDGYLSEVLESQPNWYRQVERLRQENSELFLNLSHLYEQVRSELPYEEIARSVRRGLRQWIDALTAHHHKETALIQTAINLEVGAGD